MKERITKQPEVLALILARGGSTGVPGKNIKLINGKPLIGYTIGVANESKYITKTIVATDSEDIRKAAIDCGAEVPFLRPSEMSQKLSRAYDVYKYFLKKLKDEYSYTPDIVVMLFSTSYTKTVGHVDLAVKKLIDTQCEWVFTVTEAEHHPYRCFKPVDDDRITVFCDGVDSFDIWGNRQELPLAYRINGNAFVTWKRNIENFTTYNVDSKEFADVDVRYIVCSQEESMDIDTPFDFAVAEHILTKKT